MKRLAFALIVLLVAPIAAEAFCPFTNDTMRGMQCRSYEMQQLQQQQEMQRQTQALEQMNQAQQWQEIQQRQQQAGRQ